MKNLAELIKKLLSYREYKNYQVMVIETTGKILERFNLSSIPEQVIKLYSKEVYRASIIEGFGLINIQIVNV